MATVIVILAVLHAVSAGIFLLLARHNSVLVDDDGRPIPEPQRREVRELTYRIAPLAPESPI